MATKAQEDVKRCPGEKYAITAAICLARQHNHYPKCLLCQHYAADDDENAEIDPRIDAAVFGSECISGQTPEQINDYTLRKIGAAAAQFVRARKAQIPCMAIGHDLREDSRALC